MDKNRRVRSRRGNVLGGEKDRQKRPGTPHRNRIQRPPNLIRMTESAAPVHTSYPDYSENEDEPRPTDSALILQEESKLLLLQCPLQPQFQRISATRVRVDENDLSRSRSIIDEALETNSTESSHRSEMVHHSLAENTLKEGTIYNLLAENQNLLTPQIPRGTKELRSTKGTKSKCNDCLARQQIPVQCPTLKPSQGSNTATTPYGTGLPPLEGIHAGIGVGPGPGFCQIGFDYSENLSDVYNLDSLENSNTLKDADTDEDDKYPGHEIGPCRVRVPNAIVFDALGGSQRAFGGIIKLQNVSQYFMTFCIKSSEPEMFSISPKIGLINPMESQDVIIKTNPRYEFSFQDVSSEVFKVFATPVYTRKQMEHYKLEVLWKALGSNFFPRIAAEEHPINFIYRYHSNYTKDSVLSVISSNHRWLSALWGNSKEVVINETGSGISEEEFYNYWPLEDDHYNFMSCRNQLDGWFWYLRKIKEETREVKYELRQCIGGFLMMFFVLLVIFSSLFPSSPSSIRVTDKIIQPFWNWISSAVEDSSLGSSKASTSNTNTAATSATESYWGQVTDYITALIQQN